MRPRPHRLLTSHRSSPTVVHTFLDQQSLLDWLRRQAERRVDHAVGWTVVSTEFMDEMSTTLFPRALLFDPR